MTRAETEVARVARDLARYLRHLQEHRGLNYMEAGGRSESTRSATRTVPAVSMPSERDMDESGAGAPAARAQSAALREQAQTWSSATKLEYLRLQNIGDCQRCRLAATRQNIVFGVGNPQAELMFVGEGPGADEDRQGEPFVGRAGERLNQWIRSLGLQREDVYIANVIKCRPPRNRDPQPDEVDACSPFLRAQISAIRPRVIVGLGRHAGMLLTGREDSSLKTMRRSQLKYVDPQRSLAIPLVVTYHPAYVLRRESESTDDLDAMIIGDLRKAMSLARSD